MDNELRQLVPNDKIGVGGLWMPRHGCSKVCDSQRLRAALVR